LPTVTVIVAHPVDYKIVNRVYYWKLVDRHSNIPVRTLNRRNF
jgi:hypothetical protein